MKLINEELYEREVLRRHRVRFAWAIALAVAISILGAVAIFLIVQFARHGR